MSTAPIFLFGGGGVGKTTLLNLYVEKYNGDVNVITEVARELLKERKIDQADLQDDDVFWDLQVQLRRDSSERSNVTNWLPPRTI
jgi:GTPase SAR1 family protein